EAVRGEDGLDSRRRGRLRQLAPVLAHATARPAHRSLGQLRLRSPVRISRYALFLGATLGLATIASSTGFAAAKGGVRTYTTPATRPMRTALLDNEQLNRSNTAAFTMTRAAGAQYVRLAALWRSIAPASPGANFVPTDPTSPGYNWAALDATVTEAENAGLIPILNITATPTWAYATPPSGVNEGTPKIDALGQFAQAIATHYDGAGGGPVADIWEVWNEPNLS